MKDKIGKAGRNLEKLCGCAVIGIGLIIGAALVYYSAFYTEFCVDDTEVSRTSTDSAVCNLLVFLGVLLFFILLSALLQRGERGGAGARFIPLVERILLIVALLYSVAAGGIWVAISHVEPYADAHSVCVVAACMLEGDFPMQPPTYMGYNPQQYGMVFVLQILFALFGLGNYAAWQYMNVLLFPLLIFAGYRLLQLLFENAMVNILYLLLVLGYLPLYFYLPYVYGDFASAACGMVIMWQTVSFCKNQSYSAVLWGTLAAVFGCMVRMNTIIVVIAAAIVLAICALCRAQWKLLVMLVVMPLAVVVANRGIVFYYEHLSGQQVSQGIPAVSYVMMGLEDTEMGPGWFDGSNYMAYARNDYDYDSARTYSDEQIQVRLGELWQNKSYAVDFFRRKVLTQWNMPDCCSLQETMYFDCDEAELPTAVQKVYYGAWRDGLENYMNRYQFVLYAGFGLAMAAFARSRERNLERYLLLIAVIGGFLFSILWEAMSRYVLAYQVYMIPLAAVGIHWLQELLKNGVQKRRSC